METNACFISSYLSLSILSVWGPSRSDKLVHIAEAAARGHGSLQHAAPDVASLRQALGNIWAAPEKTGYIKVVASIRKRKMTEEDLGGENILGAVGYGSLDDSGRGVRIEVAGEEEMAVGYCGEGGGFLMKQVSEMESESRGGNGGPLEAAGKVDLASSSAAFKSISMDRSSSDGSFSFMTPEKRQKKLGKEVIIARGKVYE